MQLIGQAQPVPLLFAHLVERQHLEAFDVWPARHDFGHRINVVDGIRQSGHQHETRPDRRASFCETVADLGRRIVYTTRTVSQADFPTGDEVIIFTEDQAAARKWRSGYASLAQTYADLWASPGWQAAEFTRALKASLFTDADWEQRTSA